MRKTQLSVTNFLHYGNEYLFLLRAQDKLIDAGKLNGIGGKLEEGEDFLSCAIRETKEETGYEVETKDIKLSGVVSLHGGYEDDWTMCFFKITVPTKDVPLGFDIADGKLMWLPKNKVLQSDYKMVDDLQYIWDKIIEEKGVFFMDALVNEEEKIEKFSLTNLPL